MHTTEVSPAPKSQSGHVRLSPGRDQMFILNVLESPWLIIETGAYSIYEQICGTFSNKILMANGDYPHNYSSKVKILFGISYKSLLEQLSVFHTIVYCSPVMTV